MVALRAAGPPAEVVVRAAEAEVVVEEAVSVEAAEGAAAWALEPAGVTV